MRAFWNEAAKPPGPLSGLGLAIIALVIVIDQVTKAVIESALEFGMAVDVLPFLALYPTYNTGISFNFFAGGNGMVLTVVTLVIVAIVLVLWGRADTGGRWVTTGFALIVGGALGNLIDRVFRGHVVDFLLLHLGGWTLFVFNVADAALTMGPVVLVVFYVFARPAGAAPERSD